MKHRSLGGIVGLTIITLGIYNIYWFVKTKGEMVKLGADIPTSWLIIVPFVSIWWLYKYSMGVDQVTEGKLQGILTFIMMWFVGFIGMLIAQDFFNKIPETAGAGVVEGVVSDVPATPLADGAVAGVAAPAADAAPAIEAPATEAPAAETIAPAGNNSDKPEPEETPPTNPIK